MFHLCNTIQTVLFSINQRVYCFYTRLNLHIVQFSLTLSNTPGSTQHGWKLLSQQLLQLAVCNGEALLCLLGEERLCVQLAVSTL